jgi:2-phospho-L-lactate guanylyltransferase
MSKLWAVVPVKRIAAAKQRLSDVFAVELRQALVLAMLEDVLTALAAVRTLAGIVVVTEDARAAEIAESHRALVWSDGADDGHTGAVACAARRLARDGAALLTVPADIPLVRPEDVSRLIAAHRFPRGFSIVPSRDERGSNAILCSPADAVTLAFGDDSFRPHLAASRAQGIEPQTIHLPRIALDIDRADDVTEFLAIPSRSHARALLDFHGVAARSFEEAQK